MFRSTYLFFSVIILSCLFSFYPALSQSEGGSKQKKGIRKTEEGGKKSHDPENLELNNGNLVLGAPSEDQVLGNIFLKKGTQAFITYHELSSKIIKKLTITGDSTGPFKFKFEGLNPGLTYGYDLFLKEPGAVSYLQKGSSWFRTAPSRGSTFCFTIQGDSHPERTGKMFNPDLYKLTLDSLSVIQPDFHFMMGDDFSLDRLLAKNRLTQSSVDQVYQLQRSYIGRIGSNPPYFLINGNHEQASRFFLDGSDTNVSVLAARARNRYFPQPSPTHFFLGDTAKIQHIGEIHDYYSFEWGDALFVVIDPYWHSDELVDNAPSIVVKKQKKDPWGITLGQVQYQWLKKTLESSNARFKFVFSHHVLGTGRGGTERANLFEWGGQDLNGTWQFDSKRPGWALPIHQLMVKNRVTIFFQGHDHLFVRQEKDGVIYQTVPNPADDSYTAFNSDAYTSGKILSNSGFLQIKVSPQKTTVTYHRTYLNSQNLPLQSKEGFEYIIPYNSKIM